MSKRGENIRKRKDGRWEGRYKSESDSSGGWKYKSVYGNTYKEVKEKLNTLKQCPSISPATSESQKMLKEVALLWLNANKIRLKGASVQRYEYLIQTHIIPAIGELELRELSAAVINTFLANKLENGRLNNSGGLSPSYVKDIMIVVKSIISFAVTEQMCHPLSSPIYKPQVRKKELNILTREEQAVLEQYTRNNINGTNVGVLISLYTGLRIGEICALTWEDIDLENKIINVRHTVSRISNNANEKVSKTRLIIDEPKTEASKRSIPIPSALLDPITQLYTVSDTKFVVSNTDSFTSPRTYEYRFHKLLSSCGIKSTNYHTLRHTFASRCVEVGVDIKSLSEILGHKDSTITLNTYVHSSMSQKRDQLDKLSFVTN